MIVNDKDAATRLQSPNNLINKLRSSNGNGASSKNNAMSLFGIGRKTIDISASQREDKIVEEVKVSFNPFSPQTSAAAVPSINPSSNLQPTKLDQILENNESQIKLGLAHDKALELLVNSVAALANKLDDVKADKLPSVISAASKTVESIRRERNEAAKSNKDREVHYHFYTPQQNKLTDYEVIDVA